MTQLDGFRAGYDFGRRHRNNPIMHVAAWAAFAAHSIATVALRLMIWVAYAVGAMLALFLLGGLINSMLAWNWAEIGVYALLVVACLFALSFSVALVRGAIAAAPAAILFAIIGGFLGGGMGALVGAALGGLIGLMGLATAARA